jgi:hypothetical protein
MHCVYLNIHCMPFHIYNRGTASALTTRTIPRPFEIVEVRKAADVRLWPSLFTLQAPVVAVLWQLLLARSVHVKLNWFEPWALGLAVWLIYVADHLIDTAKPAGKRWEPPRKEFCRQHRMAFLAMAFVVGVILLLSVSRFLWAATVRGGWQLSLGVACYFGVIHLTPRNWRSDWPREIVVAAIFTLGTFGAVWVGNGKNVLPLLAPAALFAMLCCANCSLIETWEWEAAGGSEIDTPNLAARWMAKHLARVGLAVAIISAAALLTSMVPGGFAISAAISGASLFVLSVFRHRIPVRLVSPVADLALCWPFAVLVFLWLS